MTRKEIRKCTSCMLGSGLTSDSCFVSGLRLTHVGGYFQKTFSHCVLAICPQKYNNIAPSVYSLTELHLCYSINPNNQSLITINPSNQTLFTIILNNRPLIRNNPSWSQWSITDCSYSRRPNNDHNFTSTRNRCSHIIPTVRHWSHLIPATDHWSQLFTTRYLLCSFIHLLKVTGYFNFYFIV